VKQPMQDADTATRIILAAEALFASHGFAQTTLRQITAKADVNLAAVNYHYGSKHGLIEAVACRFVDPLCRTLDQMLAERLAADAAAPRVEELLELLVRTLLQVQDRNASALALFMRLLDLAYMPGQEELRQFLSASYAPRLASFLQLLRKDCAPMQDNEFFWRLHFLLGSLVFTLSNYETLNQLEREAGHEQPDIERILHRMIPVISAGFQARAESTLMCRV